METENEKIIDGYRKADFNKRLHIYLQFPGLREDFLDIGRKEAGSGPSTSVLGPGRCYRLLNKHFNLI